MEFLAWPSVILILGLTALFLFKRPLERFLDRAQKISKGGIEAGLPTQTQRKEVEPSSADEFMKLFDNALLVQREQWIRNELEKMLGSSQTEREKILIRLLAANSIVQHFEETYRVIWGSQLGALEFANTAGASGLEKDFLRTWYNQAVARQPLWYQNYTFEQWLGFLYTSQLLLAIGDKVVITLEGREFLKYILHQGYTLYKPG